MISTLIANTFVSGLQLKCNDNANMNGITKN